MTAGVALITTILDDARPTGLSTSSLASFSIDPPSVMLSVPSDFARHLDEEEFGVSLLNVDHSGLAEASWHQAVELEEIDWIRTIPLIPSAIAHMVCYPLVSEDIAGIALIVAEVRDAAVGHGNPLLYHVGAIESVEVIA